MAGNVNYIRYTRAKGCLDEKREVVKLTIELPQDMFTMLSDKAFKEKVSCASIIREYIEWGLENG